MKKRFFIISLTLALVATILMSTTALAAGWTTPKKPVVQSFSSVMTPTAIDAPVISSATWPQAIPAESNNWPIVDLVEGSPTIVGWIVDSRSVYGGFTGNLIGNGVFTYGGILDLLQSGSMQGNLVVNTGGVDCLYMAASGKLAANVIDYYTFEEIVAWCQGTGIPAGMVLAQIYNAPQLALLPDGNMTFAQLQAWCQAIGLTTGQFFAGVTGNPDLANLPDAVIESMYGTVLPVLSGLQILGSMYGTALPSLPKTMSATFSGTLSIESGTGVYNGANGNGLFGPYKNKPLTLHVSPAQHVESLEGSIQITGTYKKRTFEPRSFNIDKLKDLVGKWKIGPKD